MCRFVPTPAKDMQEQAYVGTKKDFRFEIYDFRGLILAFVDRMDRMDL